MKIAAQLNYLRLSPRKVRAVADLMRTMSVSEAEFQLEHSKKRAAHHLLKLLRSALANAKHNFYLDSDDLRIAELVVNEGPTLKRFMPRARGRATPIHKRTSHVRLILSPKTAELEERSYAERKEQLSIEAPTTLEDADIFEEGATEEEAATKEFQQRERREDDKRSSISPNLLKEIGKRVFRRKSF